MHVGEPEIPAGVAVGELFVVEAEQAEHGGVQVVDVHALFHSLKSEFVGGAVNLAALDAAAGQPDGSAVRC